MMGVTQISEAVLVASSIAAAGAITALLLSLRARLRTWAGRWYRVSGTVSAGSPEHFFMSIHGLLEEPIRRVTAGQPWISLAVVGRPGRISFEAWVPEGKEELVDALVRAAFPGGEMSPIDEAARPAAVTRMARGRLAKGSALPIRTSFEAEPLAGLTSTLARLGPDEEVFVELAVRPKGPRWAEKLRARAVGAGDARVATGRIAGAGRRAGRRTEQDRSRAMVEKAASPAFDCALRVAAAASDAERASRRIRALAPGFGPYAAANWFEFARQRIGRLERGAAARRFPLFGTFVLNARELAGLWHLPAVTVPRFEALGSPKLAPPAGADRGERLLGRSTWAGEDLPVRLSVADSRHHLHFLGPTGTGKTTALLGLATQDVRAGRGVAVLDPKGDLVRGLLERLPRERIDDVVLISPDDQDCSVGVNPLEVGEHDDRELIAENTLTIFKRIYADSWGMRTDDILKATVLTLLQRPDATLAHIPLLLTDSAFRARTIPSVREMLGLDSFWQWYGRLSDYQRVEAIGPILNKLRDFLVRPRLRRVLCQPRSTVDLRTVVDSGQILLADLSVGRWGETASALLGSFLVAKLWQAVLARAGTPEDERRDFFLFIDEFHRFVGIRGPFGDALAEARSLRLSLTIANQHLGQLPRDLRDAVISNARSRAVFQCGPYDARSLAREFDPLDAAALMALPRFEMAVRLSIDGRTSGTFTARTVAPEAVGDPSVRDEVRAASARRYGRPAAALDEELRELLKPGPRAASGGGTAVRYRR